MRNFWAGDDDESASDKIETVVATLTAGPADPSPLDIVVVN